MKLSRSGRNRVEYIIAQENMKKCLLNYTKVPSRPLPFSLGLFQELVIFQKVKKKKKVGGRFDPMIIEGKPVEERDQGMKQVKERENTGK